MTDLPTKGERTSQAIVEAAYSLFIEQGFHATSMRQIARRADVTVSAIYNHFSAKEEIFDRVLLDKHPYHQVLEILRSTPGESVDAFARDAARAVVAELGRRPEFLKLAFIELSEFKGMHGPRLFQTIFPQFLSLLDRFKGSGDELRQLPPQAILLSFLGMFFAYYLTEVAIHPGSAAAFDRDSLSYYLDIYLHGILKVEQP